MTEGRRGHFSFSLPRLVNFLSPPNSPLFCISRWQPKHPTEIYIHSPRQNRPALQATFANDALCVPDPEPVEGCDITLPYYIVEGDIFRLKTWLLRSLPGRSQRSESHQIFSYRLSRARRVIENAFGILRARWHVFSCPIQASVETTEEITKAAVGLYNYLRQTNSDSIRIL